MKKQGLFIFFIIVIIFFLLLAPSYVADYEEDLFWARNDDTIVLTNTSHNVNIGKNATTSYQLELNGNAYFNGTIDTNTGNDTEWDLAYSWGDHSLIGYLTTWADGDPFFNASASYHITQVMMDNWNASASGNPFDQDLNTTDSVIFDNVRLVDSLIATGSLNVTTSGSAKPDLFIDTNGISSKPYESCCRVRLSSSQLVLTNTWTKLLLATENYDQNNDFAFYRFVAPFGGVYIVTYSVEISDITNTYYMASAIYVNGIRAGGYENQYATGTQDLYHSGSDCFQLSQNDYVELWVYHNVLFASKWFSTQSYTNYMTVCKIA